MGTKISAYSADSTPKGDFELIGTDPDDTSMASSGTTKKVTLALLGQEVEGGWHDLVRDYGADPTGGTSASTALANACAAAVAVAPAPFGLKVPPGKFLLSASQDLPGNMIFLGSGNVGGDVSNVYGGTLFTLSSSFSGTYVFGFKDNPDHSTANGCSASLFTIIGNGITGTAVNGLYIYGPALTILREINLVAMTGWAVYCYPDLSAAEIGSYGQNWYHVTADSCGTVAGGGFYLAWCEDSIFHNVYSIGNNNGPGFYITACDNTKFIECNAEWNSTHGYYLTGDWQYATGSVQFIGCSTDSNTNDGMHIDATWTTGGPAGTGPCLVLVSGCFFRRDGKGAAVGTGTYAGISIGATTLPILFNGFGMMPGIGDGGGGTMTPNYGIYFSQSSYSQPVLFSSGLAWGVTGAINHLGTSGFPGGVNNANIMLAHGGNNAPTYGS